MAISPTQSAISKSHRRFDAIFALPLLAAIGVVCLSPNYRQVDKGQVREGPIGGDFLQEWIGATIVGSGNGPRLYDAEYARQVQHDAALLGFEWSPHEYYPIVYPPFYYWLLSPLALWGLQTAAIIWCLLNGLAFSIALWLLSRYAASDWQKPTEWIALSVFYFPLLLSLNMGQKSGLLTLIFVGSFVLLTEGRRAASGIVAGCMFFKPHLGLVLFPTMLLKRRFAFIIAAALPVTLGLLISLMMGSEACQGFFNVCVNAASYASTPGYSLANSHTIWTAVAMALPSTPPATSLVVAWTIALAVVLVLLLISLKRARSDDRQNRLFFSAIIVGTVLLAPHFYTYDLSLLLIPMWLMIGTLTATPVANSPGQSQSRRIERRWHLAMIVVLFLSAGLLPKVNALAHLPISTALLLAWLVLIARESFATGRDVGRAGFATFPCANTRTGRRAATAAQ